MWAVGMALGAVIALPRAPQAATPQGLPKIVQSQASHAKPAVVVLRDANTGLEIRQTTDPAASGLAVEVRDAQVSIRKENRPTGARVILSGDRGEVVVAIGETGVTVSGVPGVGRVDQLEAAAYQRAQALLGRSTVVRDARTLLDRLDLSPTTAFGSALLLTKVLLGTLVGDAAAVAGYRAAIAPQTRGPRVVKTGFQKLGGGPGACWDTYQDYLMQIWNDFWDCVGQNWNSWLYYACEGKWLLQGELAMSWLIACSGGLPVQ